MKVPWLRINKAEAIKAEDAEADLEEDAAGAVAGATTITRTPRFQANPNNMGITRNSETIYM